MRGGLGLLIGAGMRRKGQEIARLKRGWHQCAWASRAGISLEEEDAELA
jgi:hypothetical protein